MIELVFFCNFIPYMKKTILIVDDFKNTRHVTRTILERAGYNVVEAEDGVDALKYFDGMPIDLLITDYNMPRMDGGELAAEVRKMDNYRFIPILLLTTETSKEKKRKVLEIGITAWIHKPFDFQKFLIIIQKSLK